jgi:signal transduction histidine kinase
MVGARWSIAIAAGAAALFTLLANFGSIMHLAYRNPPLHVAVETAASLISLVAAQLIYGRFRRSYLLSDLLLTASLTTFAVANLFFSAIPAVADGGTAPFATWAPVAGRLLGAALLALAALWPDRTLRHPTRDIRRVIAGCLVALVAVAFAVALAGDGLPPAVGPDLSPESASRPRVTGQPTILGAQLVDMLLFALAAIGFARRSERTGDGLAVWLAIAATLGSFSRLNYFLFPSLYSQHFYVGDVLRLGFFLALLTGGMLELRRTQRTLLNAAVLQERERIARDIHDGVAQDIAFILLHGRRLAGRDGAPAGMDHLVRAAQRALDETRHAIAALARSSEEPLSEAVTLTAHETAGREDCFVEMDLDCDMQVPSATQEVLLRVLREAIINAIRHGGASSIRVELRDKPTLRMAVVDDGRGFDVEDATSAPGRLGLRSMATRVRAIGGDLVIESEPGRGSRVEVLMP